TDIEFLPLRAEFGGDGVGELLRRFPRGFSGALHLLAVLIGAGEHHGVVALHAFETRDGLGGHGGVRMPDVRSGIHVVQRSRQVVFHLVNFRYAKLASAMMCLSATPVCAARRRQSSYSGA